MHNLDVGKQYDSIAVKYSERPSNTLYFSFTVIEETEHHYRIERRNFIDSNQLQASDEVITLGGENYWILKNIVQASSGAKDVEDSWYQLAYRSVTQQADTAGKGFFKRIFSLN